MKQRSTTARPKKLTVRPTVAMPPPAGGDSADDPYLPQLLNALPDDELDQFIARLGSDWGAQEKHDGKRIILWKRVDAIVAFNRTGNACAISAAVADYARQLAGDFVLDGELIGDDYHAFDMLSRHGADLRGSPYATRHRALMQLIGGPNGWPIHPVPLYTGEKAIRRFLAELRQKNAEGIVFKDLLAPYTAGRPNRGGPQLKVKFTATCSAVVVAHNDQRSVGLALYINETEGVAIGNVAIPANHPVPPVGAVVEVRYLYAYQGGALYQPVYLGERDDIPNADCTLVKQALKYKPTPTTGDSADEGE